jgi:UDP-N-acetylglucosamine transferase subunit ALG13
LHSFAGKVTAPLIHPISHIFYYASFVSTIYIRRRYSCFFLFFVHRIIPDADCVLQNYKNKGINRLSLHNLFILSALPKKILIAPLDWGLGHTTRCLPVIAALLHEGHTVVAAADGAPASILKAQFPGLQMLPLKGYDIRYSRNAKMFMPKLLLQIPKIIGRIIYEHRWLKRVQAQHQFDIIISDNRYGLYHPALTYIIMTHQLKILSGMGRFADKVLLSRHRSMLERFDQCWVVDDATKGLSGILAHPEKMPANATYIGPLSQFMRYAAPDTTVDHCLVLLSGPEPMRSQLEHILWRQCCTLTGYRFTFVAGNIKGKAPDHCPEHIQYYPYLGGAALQEAMATARLVICRSGYSTLMDLDYLQKPAILIPTPGQTEQEYLARYWADSGRAVQYSQDKIQLEAGIAHIYNKHHNISPETSTDRNGNGLKALSLWLRQQLYK